MKVLRHIVRKEFIQLRRDRKMIPLLVAAPILQLLILGYAANLDVNQIPLVLVDRDRTAQSRELAGRFTGSRTFTLVGVEEETGGVDKWLVKGDAQVALIVREGFGRSVLSGETAEVAVIADGSDANSAMMGLNYASAIVTGAAAELEAARLVRARSLAPVAGGVVAAGANATTGTAGLGRTELVSRVWYNPDLKSRWFYIPAILAMVLMLTTMVLPSMAVVREKEIGTLEQIIVTPIRSWELIVGKLLPFAVIGLVTTVAIAGVAVAWFGVPLRGSILVLELLTALFLLNTLGLGLLTSTLVQNQQQAMMSSIFLLQVPMIYLSGLMFPLENMPAAIQAATYLIPLRYYNTIIRAIFLKGAGLETLWPQALALLGLGSLFLALAARRFRKRLD